MTKFSKDFYEGAIFIPKSLFDKIHPTQLYKISSYFFGYADFTNREWRKLWQEGLAEEYFLDENDIVNILKNKQPQKIKNAVKICDWCMATTYVLHSHHYPIRKSKGGQETINICPSCHCEFHYLLDKKNYRLVGWIREEFEMALNDRQSILNSFPEVLS